MTTERDIRNQIRYAEKHGREEQNIENAHSLKTLGVDIEIIAKALKLTEEQVRSL